MANALMRIVDRISTATGIDSLYVANALALLVFIWAAKSLDDSKRWYRIGFYMALVPLVLITILNLYKLFRSLIP